ncbi:hypothetical protein [Ralstonia sp. SET104]|nr:hypothetical protein [Ralstonia sp. SET104]
MSPFIALCLLITYVVWGTTYLAIRFGVIVLFVHFLTVSPQSLYS